MTRRVQVIDFDQETTVDEPPRGDRPALNPDAIPDELRALPRWVNWSLEQRDGKATKIPKNPNTGRNAAADKPSTWGTFDAACTALARNDGFAGIGFVFNGDGLAGIDLDHVIADTGSIDPEAAGIVADFATYSELSQSGTGLHLICRATLPEGRGRRKGNVELYSTGRFFVMTGNHWPDSPATIEPRQEHVDALLARMFPPKGKPLPTPVERYPVNASDHDLIEKAKAASNGARFAALWAGDWRAAGHHSQSEADAALLSMLRFWTGGDKQRSFALFTQSGLHRDKWEREDYRESTWAAIDKGEVFDPRPLAKSTEPETVETDHKPAVALPSGTQPISDTGAALGELMGKTLRFFIRGGAVVKLDTDPDGFPVLEDIRPAALASDFESVAYLCKADAQGKIKAAVCREGDARLIGAAAAFRDRLPPIRVLTRCPVLIERNGKLIQVAGYDRESGIMAAGDPAELVDVEEARRLLWEVLDGFRFATPADRARALAAMVTPALVFGGLLRGRAPVDLGEADASQTGKGFRNKLTGAIYRQTVRTVSQQKAGVGSLEESFNAALIRGANFICLDNVRGRIDSPAFESFLTEDSYSARMPYREPIEIDPRRVVVMLTSNKADVTTDLANRSACVRMLKQPDGFTFTRYPEGDILEHVRAKQPQFLGAVFSIVSAWHAAGSPRTTETRHDFRPWAQALDWICQNLLEAGPLLDGHRETQARMTNPVLSWLRDVALEVIRAKQADAWLRASDIVELIADTGTETPGLPEHGDVTDHETRRAAQQATGRRLSLCFRAGDVLDLDGMTIERREGYEPAIRCTVREYRFTAAASDEVSAARIAASPVSTRGADGRHDARRPVEQSEMELRGYCAASGAANDAAMKSLCAANAANTLQHINAGHGETEKGRVEISTIANLQPHSRKQEPQDDYEAEERAAIQAEGCGDVWV